MGKNGAMNVPIRNEGHEADAPHSGVRYADGSQARTYYNPETDVEQRLQQEKSAQLLSRIVERPHFSFGSLAAVRLEQSRRQLIFDERTLPAAVTRPATGQQRIFTIQVLTRAVGGR
jgi:hypothetical protein